MRNIIRIDLKVAVDVAIFNIKGEVLLGRRLAKEGFGMWGFPGGHMNPNETVKECARRELKEELGQDIKVDITSEIIAVRENKIAPNFIHHVTIILKAKLKSGLPKIMEPQRCKEWRFVKMKDLDKYSLFSGVGETIKNFKKGKALIVSDWYIK
ncbi:MAG: NUDIX domain-containing protein [Candidatus Levybacteria bacterium]|nr:NUDIX domain-containing protein [Candidatus Levybacteria bacterium]